MVKGDINLYRGIEKGFYKFEEISEEREWEYRKSILNEFDTSESNIFPWGFNQLIIQDFLYEDITTNPKIYMARRTKGSLNYFVGEQYIETSNLQMEIDLTLEKDGYVTVFEGKNDFPENFAVYQLFHPYLYYQNLKKQNGLAIKEIDCCYFLRKKQRNGGSSVRVYLYTFDESDNLASIRLKKSKQYNLVYR